MRSLSSVPCANAIGSVEYDLRVQVGLAASASSTLILNALVFPLTENTSVSVSLSSAHTSNLDQGLVVLIPTLPSDVMQSAFTQVIAESAAPEAATLKLCFPFS